MNQDEIKRSNYIRILSSPVGAFREILSLESEKEIYILMAFGGAINAVGRAASQNFYDTRDLASVLLTAFLAGGLFGFLGYFIFGGLLAWTGRWLKGTSDMNKMTIVLSWSVIPMIISFGFTLIEILFTGDAIFKSNPEVTESGWFLIQTVVYIHYALLLWQISLIVIGISIAQSFTIGKAILNFLLPFIVILVPIFLLILIFKN